MFDDDEEVLGEPVFEIDVRDGEPIVAGSYFMLPPVRQRTAHWDPECPGRLVVEATDGSVWYADGVELEGRHTVRLTRLETTNALDQDPSPAHVTVSQYS